MSKYQSLEIDLLIEALYKAYGYDFRGYSESHMTRRILNRVEKESLSSISEVQDKVLNEPGYADLLIKEFSINVTEFFRDATFYKQFRKEIIPYLKSFPKIKIWHAGCSTGEEVYSMAMILHEEGLLDRCQIYGTDFNEQVLDLSKKGSFDLTGYQLFRENYGKIGGTEDLNSYVEIKKEQFVIRPFLKKNMSFHQHNLVADQVFGEMTLIVCRNVLIYFTKAQQDKVLELLDGSLRKSGVLCLGAQETIHKSSIESNYRTTYEADKIYIKNIINKG